jgi:CheY-like chemotaxis protein
MNKPLRVMIVDDEPLLRDFARNLLEEAGYAADVAADANEALDKLTADSFNIVVSDIYMPGELNGLEFAKRVAEQFPATRVVLMTGRYLPSLDDLPDGTLLMLKPFVGDNLLSLLRFSGSTLPARHDAPAQFKTSL